MSYDTIHDLHFHSCILETYVTSETRRNLSNILKFEIVGVPRLVMS
jgi:hypothetical protein